MEDILKSKQQSDVNSAVNGNKYTATAENKTLTVEKPKIKPGSKFENFYFRRIRNTNTNTNTDNTNTENNDESIEQTNSDNKTIIENIPNEQEVTDQNDKDIDNENKVVMPTQEESNTANPCSRDIGAIEDKKQQKPTNTQPRIVCPNGKFIIIKQLSGANNCFNRNRGRKPTLKGC